MSYEARPDRYRYRVVSTSGRTSDETMQWLGAHALDACSIPLDSEIVCDDIERTISAATFTYDSNGQPIVQNREPVTDEITHQLESVALPTPACLSVHYTNERPASLDGLTIWETA
jgi:hypothetical protein